MSKRKAKELKLSDKQRRFCLEYVTDHNATRAAKAAGYSEKTANVIGSQNLSKLNVSEYIDYLNENIEETLGLSRLKVAQEYQKMAFGNVTEIFNDWVEKKHFDQLSDDIKSCVAEIQTNVRRVEVGEETFQEIEFVKVKFHDKNKALEALRKMFGYDQPEVIHNVNHEGVEPPKIRFK